MAWRFVKQPNGLIARFSEIVDEFTHYDMTEAEAVDVALDFMGRQDAADKVSREVRDLDPRTNAPGDGLSRFRDAIETIRFVHGEEQAKRREDELSANA